MLDAVVFSEEELEFRKVSRQLSNSGKLWEAFEAAKAFLSTHPESMLAKQTVGTLAGDCACDDSLTPQARGQLKAMAKTMLVELFHDPRLEVCPKEFAFSLRNEYYWNFGLRREQYELGVTGLADGLPRAHYSKCVGAALEAESLLQKGELEAAEEWARRSVKAFSDFEKVDPAWANIQYFLALALSVLGRGEEAKAAYRVLFVKQGRPVSDVDCARFDAEMEKLLARRAALESASPRGRVAAVRAYWEAIEARDWEGAWSHLHDDFEAVWPVTGERFDRVSFAKVNEEYPSSTWHVELARVHSLEEETLSIVQVRDGDRCYFCTSVFRFRGARMESATEYWADGAPAPEGRRGLTI